MMRAGNLARFEKAIRAGAYLFHFHTSITDGANTLPQYCEAAKKCGFRSLIITEHVRRKCTFDFPSLLEEAKKCEEAYEIPIILGVEAKVLPEGFLDVSDDIIVRIHVLGIAVHSFPFPSTALAEALVRVFERYRGTDVALVWLHPGSHLLDREAGSGQLLKDLLSLAVGSGVYIELNVKHSLPPEDLRVLVPPTQAVIGVDAHSVDEVRTYASMVLDMEKAWSHRMANHIQKG